MPDHDHDRPAFVAGTSPGDWPPAVPAPAPAPSFPPLATQFRNLAGAVVAAVASGGRFASAEERARRLSICAACEFLSGGRCTKCGCRARYKVLLSAWHCPIRKF